MWFNSKKKKKIQVSQTLEGSESKEQTHICVHRTWDEATGPVAQAHTPVLALRQVIMATAQTELSTGLHAPFRR